ncbi:MAG: acyl-CoA synthetase [Rhodospirillaceae bacterium]|nr:acyl-CoA synthetase [Rhodospirillaceae bacterium]|tara:strand:- start:55 stop:369 length:315 start_codon:yes stop_codon:yes gene_type:complete
MATIGELAKLVRSKNAGPFVMTIDIMFADQKTYDTVKSSGILNRQMVSKIYNMSENQVQFFEVDNCYAFKISIPRPNFQGDIKDSDSHAGQQYAPFIEIEVPGT